MAGAIMDSKSVHYNTPQWIVDFVREVMGEIDLDPCSNENSIVKATREYMLEKGDDGLRDPWNGRVYCNPPYGSIKVDKETGKPIGGNLGTSIKDWFEKARAELAAGRCTGLVLCVPNVPDRSWFHNFVYPTADAALDLKGRVCFFLDGVEEKQPSGCVGLYYWGPDHVRFCELGEALGHRALNLNLYRKMWNARKLANKEGLLEAQG